MTGLLDNIRLKKWIYIYKYFWARCMSKFYEHWTVCIRLELLQREITAKTGVSWNHEAIHETLVLGILPPEDPPPTFSVATFFRFVTRVRIEDSSRNRFTSTAYFSKPDYVGSMHFYAFITSNYKSLRTLQSHWSTRTNDNCAGQGGGSFPGVKFYGGEFS